MPVLVSRARDAGAHGRLGAMRSRFAAETMEDSDRVVATYVAPTKLRAEGHADGSMSAAGTPTITSANHSAGSSCAWR